LFCKGNEQKPVINTMDLNDGEIIYDPMQWNAGTFNDTKFSLWKIQEIDVKFISIGEEVKIRSFKNFNLLPDLF